MISLPSSVMTVFFPFSRSTPQYVCLQGQDVAGRWNRKEIDREFDFDHLIIINMGQLFYTLKNPLMTLCDCGSRKVFTDIEEQLNRVIDAGNLEKVCHVVR